jgi:cyclic pyranopterin phosphate synthase
MTTNGVRLNELAEPLRNAGLKRINVSLCALDSETYRAITGVDAFSRVLEGIIEASAVGLKPIKVNMVILKGLMPFIAMELIFAALLIAFPQMATWLPSLM